MFGWTSTNPVYGGAGSGSLSDNYPKVSLLEGLANSNFKTNTALSDFYVGRAASDVRDRTVFAALPKKVLRQASGLAGFRNLLKRPRVL